MAACFPTACLHVSILYSVPDRSRVLVLQASVRPAADYMTVVQHDINSQMRAILVDWLVEVAEEYSLHPETLYICVSAPCVLGPQGRTSCCACSRRGCRCSIFAAVLKSCLSWLAVRLWFERLVRPLRVRQVSYIDRCLSKFEVVRGKLQLLGCGCMLLAA